MKNIDEISPFKSTIKNTDFGVLITLEVAFGISKKGSVSFDEKSLLTNYIYTKDETYNLVYTLINKDGTTKSYVEDDGILPTLFLSPNQEGYVSIVPYHPDKELEISIPIFNRENTEVPKGKRPFVGKFIGTSNQFSIFYDVDIWSDKKPDKLFAIEFKNGVLKKRHNIKVPLPRNNNIFISDNEIHLLTRTGDILLHRQIDEKGKEIKQREIEVNQKNFREILSLSFDQDSYLLSQVQGKILVEKIGIDKTSEVTELINLGDPFFNTWQPVKVAEDTFVTIFNGEFGNGWFTTKKDQLLEIFYSKGECGYKNLVTSEVLQMDNEKIVISSINKTAENSYAVIFYPMTERGVKNKNLIILNREID